MKDIKVKFIEFGVVKVGVVIGKYKKYFKSFKENRMVYKVQLPDGRVVDKSQSSVEFTNKSFKRKMVIQRRLK